MISKLFLKTKEILKTSFVRDTVIMQAGSVFTTAVNIFGSVAFARILLPEKYGLYGLVFAFAGLLDLFMSWGVDKAALVLFAEAYEKKDREEIRNILVYFVKMSIMISLFVGIPGMIIAPILSFYLYGNLYIGELVRIVVLANIVSLFFTFTTMALQVMRRIKSYVFWDNFRNFLRVFGGTLLVFVMGLYGVLAAHLGAFVLSFIISIFLYIRLASKNELLPSFKEILSGWRNVRIRKYFKFGFLIALDQNIGALYGILPVLFLGMFSPVKDVGYFNIAFKYVTLPLILLSPVGQLLNVRFPQMKTGDLKLLRRNFFKVSVISGVLALCLVVPTLILGPFLIKLFYGTKYLDSIPLIYYLAPYTILAGFAVGIGPIFRALNKVWLVVMINSFIIFSGIIPAYFLVKSKGLVGISLVTVGWLVAVCLLSFIFINYLIKKSLTEGRCNKMDR